MRSFAHWTPTYVKDRLAEVVYHYRKPSEPWLTERANFALSSLLRRGDVGVEYGSGRSTVWLAKRVKHVTSVEHNRVWFDRVVEMLDSAGVTNVELLLESEGEANREAYLAAFRRFSANALDFVLVDGIHRGECAAVAISKLRCGGMLIIDNVNWYLPSSSRSPNSRSPGQGPIDSNWKRVAEVVSEWRVFWTSSGVTDTAIFFKPCELV